MFRIIVNGQDVSLDQLEISYEDIVRLVCNCDADKAPLLTIMVRTPAINGRKLSCSLSPGNSIALENGMIFNAYNTGNS